ncbi:MAG: hypothetical protein EBZ75_14745 [Oxalobacteraceae bacterium]|nr:hypothetical protein [Oxalobacteraceae bacterium]
MTTFQLVSFGLFCAVAVVAYRKELLAKLSSLRARVPGVQTSIAVPLVDDILAVTKLRDKLAAEGCTAGVDACTALLRVIVEYEQPSKGVV